jgi:hypothetical protein
MIRRLTIPVLLLAIAGQMAFTHVYNVYQMWDETPVHVGIVAGTEEPPFRYRVLVPFAAEALRPLFPVGARESIVLAYEALSVVFITGFVFTVYGFLRRFYAPSLALLGVALVGMAAQVAVIRPTMLAWSWLEAWLLTLAVDWLWCNVWSAGEAGKREMI